MIKVTCAIILKDNKVLVAQRSEEMKLPLKWEFPGGKIEESESAEYCIIRELREELNVKIKLIQRLNDNVHHYQTFSIKLIPFLAEYVSGEIILAEHKCIKWLERHQLKSLDWAPADIPILDEFLNLPIL